MGRSDPAPMLPGIDTERDALDRYYTPPDVTRGLVAALGIPRDARVIEPSVGGGAWVRALRESGHTGTIIGVDLDAGATGLQLCDQWLYGRWESVSRQIVDGDGLTVVLGNPPFRDAAIHVRAARRRGWCVAFLLRSTFVEPVESANDVEREHRKLWRDERARRDLFEVESASETEQPHSDLWRVERARRKLWRDDPCTVELTWPLRIRFGGAAKSDSVLHSMFVWGSPTPRPNPDGWRRRLVWPDHQGQALGCFSASPGGSHA